MMSKTTNKYSSEVRTRTVRMILDNEAEHATLETETIAVDIAAHRLRCSKQVKLVVGEIETESREIDHRLVTLIADARRWFESLKSGRRVSIAKIEVVSSFDIICHK